MQEIELKSETNLEVELNLPPGRIKPIFRKWSLKWDVNSTTHPQRSEGKFVCTGSRLDIQFTQFPVFE